MYNDFCSRKNEQKSYVDTYWVDALKIALYIVQNLDRSPAMIQFTSLFLKAYIVS